MSRLSALFALFAHRLSQRVVLIAALVGAALLVVTPVYAQDSTTTARGLDPIMGLLAVLGFGALLMVGFVSTIRSSARLDKDEADE